MYKDAPSRPHVEHQPPLGSPGSMRQRAPRPSASGPNLPHRLYPYVFSTHPLRLCACSKSICRATSPPILTTPLRSTHDLIDALQRSNCVSLTADKIHAQLVPLVRSLPWETLLTPVHQPINCLAPLTTRHTQAHTGEHARAHRRTPSLTNIACLISDRRLAHAILMPLTTSLLSRPAVALRPSRGVPGFRQASTYCVYSVLSFGPTAY